MYIAGCPERLVSLIHNSINIVSVCSQVTPVGQADPGLGFVAQNWLVAGAVAVGDAVPLPLTSACDPGSELTERGACIGAERVHW